jgi:predicted N-acyltransferase
MQAEFITSLAQVNAREWDRLAGDDYPFLRHDFLYGLERSDCTTARSGWQPCHLLLRDGDTLRALLPMYLKGHSYGEYVFDWSWADAWRRSGLEYYPKLLSAIPFTPASGPRLCVAANWDENQAWDLAIDSIRAFAGNKQLSSWHLLFPGPAVSEHLRERGLLQRQATQFHWHNEDYRDFDDFLARFNSRKRKALRRERRRVAEQGLALKALDGTQLGEEDWEQFHRFYQLTYARRSGHSGYLTREFFTDVAAGMGQQVMMVQAREGSEMVAAALYFRSSSTLFGRYWGCLRDYDCLHFEACYYQGIEYCIQQGLQRFDPGAQGEHKIQRGFRPVTTFSNHWIADAQLAAAVADFTERERTHNALYQQQAAELLPFKS